MDFIYTSYAVGTLLIWNVLIALGIPEYDLEVAYANLPDTVLFSGMW
ncbi:hypothetical protein [uncultured Corynebacterium sp.]|nr:hypothetical protein [uncultured Corynebacterium sp.]